VIGQLAAASTGSAAVSHEGQTRLLVGYQRYAPDCRQPVVAADRPEELR
jgi:hypothetical protein